MRIYLFILTLFLNNYCFASDELFNLNNITNELNYDFLEELINDEKELTFTFDNTLGSIPTAAAAAAPDITSQEEQLQDYITEMSLEEASALLNSLKENSESQEQEEQEEDKKPFVCDKCPQKFKRLQHLRRHEGIHTGQELFACKICNKNFTRLYNRNEHEKNILIIKNHLHAIYAIKVLQDDLT